MNQEDEDANWQSEPKSVHRRNEMKNVFTTVKLGEQTGKNICVGRNYVERH